MACLLPWIKLTMDALLSQADYPDAGAQTVLLSTDFELEMPSVYFAGYGYFYLSDFRK